MIAITGASCSGKSTLSITLRSALQGETSSSDSVEKRNLSKSEGRKQNHIRCEIIQQDDFFLPPWTRPLSRVVLTDGHEVENWEECEAIDWPSLESSVQTAYASLKKWEESQSIEMDVVERQGRAKADQEAIDHFERKEGVLVIEGFCLLYSSFIRSVANLSVYLEVDREVARERRRSRDSFVNARISYFDELIWPHHMMYLHFLESEFKMSPFLDANEEEWSHSSLYSITHEETQREDFVRCFIQNLQRVIQSTSSVAPAAAAMKNHYNYFAYIACFLFLLFGMCNHY